VGPRAGLDWRKISSPPGFYGHIVTVITIKQKVINFIKTLEAKESYDGRSNFRRLY